MKMNLSFYECEHEGDLEQYIEDVTACGGTVVDSEINDEAEVGHVTVEVEDRKAFDVKFKETDAYQFIN